MVSILTPAKICHFIQLPYVDGSACWFQISEAADISHGFTGKPSAGPRIDESLG